MTKVLISIPDKIASRMRASIPQKQRSKVIAQLIEKEIEKREKALYECAVAVEQDNELNQEMKDWNVTLQDGLTDESW
jgi:metal-responsive CopG/Arc/MetJ family transcriptional regulator